MHVHRCLLHLHVSHVVPRVQYVPHVLNVSRVLRRTPYVLHVPRRTTSRVPYVPCVLRRLGSRR